jgi:hypothetical protein
MQAMARVLEMTEESALARTADMSTCATRWPTRLSPHTTLRNSKAWKRVRSSSLSNSSKMVLKGRSLRQDLRLLGDMANTAKATLMRGPMEGLV